MSTLVLAVVIFGVASVSFAVGYIIGAALGRSSQYPYQWACPYPSCGFSFGAMTTETYDIVVASHEKRHQS